MDLYTSNIFKKNWNANTRIVCNQGGTRSSKTYSILQLIVLKCLQETDKTWSICRKTFPALKATAMRDFIEILNHLGLYDYRLHNKSESTYNLNGNLIEFLSVDEPQKIRGRKRNYLFLNEANEFSFLSYFLFYFNYYSNKSYFFYFSLLLERHLSLISAYFY